MTARFHNLVLLASACLMSVTNSLHSEEPSEDGNVIGPKQSSLVEIRKIAESNGNDQTLVSSENYWIVSSRCSPQDLAFAHSPIRLRYFECCPNSDARQLKTPSEFRKSLDPKTPICLFVHGSFFSDRDAVVDAKKTYQWIRKGAPERDLQFVYYTWPSKGRYSLIANNPATSPVPQIDVGILGRRAEFNGFYLAQLIASMPSNAKICVVGHSHGTRIASSALHLLAGGVVQDRLLPCENNATQRIRVVHTAAAIDHHWLNPGERYGRALCRTDCLLSLRNRSDAVLIIYPLRRPLSRTALAHSGFFNSDLARMGILASRVSEIDVSGIISVRHFWPHYRRFPELAKMIAPMVYFTDFDGQ